MRFYIVIPAHNEQDYLRQTLESLVRQTLQPGKIVIVDDNSTDNTHLIAEEFTKKYDFIIGVKNNSSKNHSPGSKVINAFYKGFDLLDNDYDVICKFDADLIFPEHYLKTVSEIFENSNNCGIAGGHCYIQKETIWKLENLTSKNHIRGALKAYRKDCFEQIGGLKKSMGWDTVDELLAQFHGWKIYTDESLHVKHLKPTGAAYSGKKGKQQGIAFRKMRYGFLLTLIASAKLASKKNSPGYFLNCIQGYFASKPDYLVSIEEGKFIRKLRWANIKGKFF